LGVKSTQTIETIWAVSDHSDDKTGRESSLFPQQTEQSADAGLRLYVGKIQEGATKADTEEMLRRHFGEWGEIVKSEFFFSSPLVSLADE
jgi:hypothetical protein